MTCSRPFTAHRQSARPGVAADDAAVSGRADAVDERLGRDRHVQADLQLPCRVRAGLLRARLLGDLSGARRQVRPLHVQRERHARLSRRLDGIVLRQRWVSISSYYYYSSFGFSRQRSQWIFHLNLEYMRRFPHNFTTTLPYLSSGAFS